MINKIEKFAISTVKKAGQILLEYYQQNEIKTKRKSTNEIVTQADVDIEKFIIQNIEKYFPEHSIFSEEKGKILKNKDLIWYLDPLDGTRNFSHKIPFFCISLAFSQQKDIILGFVYDPIHQEFFTAKKTKGAYVNNQKITVNQTKSFRQSLCILDWRYSSNNAKNFSKIYSQLSHSTNHLKSFGSAALDLCYLASGRIDLVILDGLRPYDWAAGALIAQEAGALISQLNKKNWNLKAKNIIAANKILYNNFFLEYWNKIND